LIHRKGRKKKEEEQKRSKNQKKKKARNLKKVKRMKYSFPPFQPLVAAPNLNPIGTIPIVSDDEESAMAEERTLLPNQFGGGPDEDPAEFRRRLDNYVAYKNLAADASIRLAKAICDWLDGLEDAKKDTLEHLKEAFTERFIQPSILRFKRVRERFSGKQGTDETVDIYVNRLRTLGRRIGLEADDNTLLYALLSGLKPSLSSFVIGKNPQTFSEAVDAARIAELSVTDAPSAVTEQLADINKKPSCR